MATISSKKDSGEFLKTKVTVKSGRKKAYDNNAYVVEALKNNYIKVNLDDEDDHYFKLNWNGSAYEGTSFGTTITSSYIVEKDFKADFKFEERNTTTVVTTAKRSKGGRPNRYIE